MRNSTSPAKQKQNKQNTHIHTHTKTPPPPKKKKNQKKKNAQALASHLVEKPIHLIGSVLINVKRNFLLCLENQFSKRNTKDPFNVPVKSSKDKPYPEPHLKLKTFGTT